MPSPPRAPFLLSGLCHSHSSTPSHMETIASQGLKSPDPQAHQDRQPGNSPSCPTCCDLKQYWATSALTPHLSPDPHRTPDPHLGLDPHLGPDSSPQPWQQLSHPPSIPSRSLSLGRRTLSAPHKMVTALLCAQHPHPDPCRRFPSPFCRKGSEGLAPENSGSDLTPPHKDKGPGQGGW